MNIVVALGGNAIARRGEPLHADTQVERVRVAASAIGDLVEAGHRIVVTHGNGPQVGLLASHQTAYPLDVLGAETEGMLGYWIERELMNRLPGTEVATLLTQVEVDPEDPAFQHPTKPIGPVLDASEIEMTPDVRNETRYVEDGGGMRRVVASPTPHTILETPSIARLSHAGVLVVCGGGGGIPVVRNSEGRLEGCEAVVDKDRSAALLADQLDFERLLLLTDVPAVYEDWPAPATQSIAEATTAEIRARPFDPGSMGPKIEAACAFARRPGRIAAIGALESASEIIRGEAGTRIRA